MSLRYDGKRESIFDKLTDPKLYTGAHKHRFDADGNGRGLAGRDRVAKGSGFVNGAPGCEGVSDLSQITRTPLHTTGAGYFPPASRGSGGGTNGRLQARTSAEGSSFKYPHGSPASPSSPSTPSPRPGSVGRSALRSSYNGGGGGGGATGLIGGSSGYIVGAPPRSSDTGKSSIFDRLHDPSNYTGMHKQRFSSNGRGRGAEGRTTANAYVSAMDNVRR
ncbi:hypothetical protein TSOC_008673 [Tetrabaena socialis]|uniref:Uncharacterized protein n=1 Tax=Tetrabaena socialis TaxID=47790 RepID=A0A2J7ZXW3_9CHLO|nr:hypothetical protein TSOC_008673 [Tetrabaena socialis]|eukprot:PNH05110.1 hypothetical protein TSOC_008673 [Tetrabaena socialis]